MNDLIIRRMRIDDEATINAALRDMGWAERPGHYLRYVEEEQKGALHTFVAERNGTPLGYVTLVREPKTGPFVGRHWPEVMDFNVFKPYRRQGVGTTLLDAAEAQAAEFSDVVTIGVGLHAGYGSAQRLYVKRGYIPDGSGVWFHDTPPPPNAPCVNDDDLVLYFSKPTKRSH